MQHEFLSFLSNYFKIKQELIIQRSIDKNIIDPSDSIQTIVDKLQVSLGFQRRLLEPLSVAFTKSTPFDTIVTILAFKDFEKHCALLVADQSNIFKLIVFKKDQPLPAFQMNSIYKIDSCYLKDGKLLTGIPPKPIWFYNFDQIFSVRDYFLDNLPECIYDEEYTKTTNLVNILGYFLVNIVNDKIFCFIHTKQLQIRIIPFKLDELDHSLSNKFVRISYCELDYGPDAYQLKMIEFSEFMILASNPLNTSFEQFKLLIRFEYPSVRMSLSELTEKLVACSKVKLLSLIQNDHSWSFLGYDSSQAVSITVFDSQFAEWLSTLLSDSTLLLIDGIYKHGKKYYLRERAENIHIFGPDEAEEITIPIVNPENITDEKLVIIDILITEIQEKIYLSKSNKREQYEKISGISQNLSISLHNYNKSLFQRILVGTSYRMFFVRSRIFNDSLYFILDSTSKIEII